MRRVCLIFLLVFPVVASTAFGQPNDTRKPASAEVAKAKTEKDLDDALAELDANSGGTDALDLGLDARRMQSLGTIR